MFNTHGREVEVQIQVAKPVWNVLCIRTILRMHASSDLCMCCACVCAYVRAFKCLIMLCIGRTNMAISKSFSSTTENVVINSECFSGHNVFSCNRLTSSKVICAVSSWISGVDGLAGLTHAIYGTQKCTAIMGENLRIWLHLRDHWSIAGVFSSRKKTDTLERASASVPWVKINS